jgi:hypothetical protein
LLCFFFIGSGLNYFSFIFFCFGSAAQELAGKVINQVKVFCCILLHFLSADIRRPISLFFSFSSLAPKLSRATQPAMEDVEVILQGMEEPSSSFMSLGGSLLGYIAPGKAMAVTQAPRFVPPIFSGSRFLMYFMLPLGSRLPTSVLVRAKTADGPLQLHLDIGPNNTLPEGGTVVHTLAARARVQDLQDGRGSTEDIVQLGLRYNLTTQHTSFVAVDNIPRNSLESLVDAGVQTHRASARMKLFAHSHLVGSAENFVLDTAGASNDVLLLDVSPLTLGVEDMAGNMVAVIPRNSVIPTRKEAVVSGRANEHGTVTIRCFQGERPRAEHNSLLATLQVTGLTPQLDHPILVIITIGNEREKGNATRRVSLGNATD